MADLVGKGGPPPDKKNFGPPPPGSHTSSAETAVNRSEAIPSSKSPSTTGTSWELTSKNSSKRGSATPQQFVHDSLAKNWGRGEYLSGNRRQ